MRNRSINRGLEAWRVGRLEGWKVERLEEGGKTMDIEIIAAIGFTTAAALAIVYLVFTAARKKGK